MWYIVDSDYLMHYGVKGMRKGSRRWTNADGSLNAAGKARYGKKVGQASPSSPTGKYSSTTGLIEGHSSTGVGAANAYSGEVWENGQSQGRVDPNDITVNGGISAAEWLQKHAEMRKRRRRKSKQANKDRFFVVKQGKNKSSTSANRPVHREKQITTSGGAYKRPAR